MRDWPLLLVAAIFFIGSAGRYMAEENSSDPLAAILGCMGSAAFGAWLYSLGVDSERSRDSNGTQ